MSRKLFAGMRGACAENMNLICFSTEAAAGCYPPSRTYRIERGATGCSRFAAANSADPSSPGVSARNSSPSGRASSADLLKQTMHSLRASGGPKVPRDFASRACETHGFRNFRYNLSYCRRFLVPARPAILLRGWIFARANFSLSLSLSPILRHSLFAHKLWTRCHE